MRTSPGNHGPYGLHGDVLLDVDFTRFTAGALTSPLGGLLYTCATAARTVQTGSSTVVSGIAADTGLIGRQSDAERLGLVLDPARTNLCTGPRDHAGWSAGSGTETGGPLGVGGITIAGPDGVLTAWREVVLSGQWSSYKDDVIVVGNPYTSTAWVKNHAGSAVTAFNWEVQYGTTMPVGTGYGADAGAAWLRRTCSDVCAGNTTLYTVPNDGRAIPGAAGAADRDGDFDMMQTEDGKYPTEFIIGARAGARLYHPLGQWFAPAGRCDVRIKLRPKGAATELDATGMTLVSSNASAANDYAAIAAATQRLTMAAGGATWSPAAALAFVRNAVTTFDLSWGGTAVNSWARYKTGAGAIVDLGNSGAPLGALGMVGAMDLLCAGVANQLGCHVERITFFRPGVLAGVPLV
jgi:hypothetical protein